MMNRNGKSRRVLIPCLTTGGFSWHVARRFSWWPRRKLRSDPEDGLPEKSDHGSDGSTLVHDLIDCSIIDMVNDGQGM